MEELWRISNGGVWAKKQIEASCVDSNALNIPHAENLPRTNVQVPFVMVTDDFH